jgi:GntR family transcriptional regulator, rspAB operon transcriptional repressor
MRIALGERASGVSARDQVYLALREAIVSAELQPGRRLSENELAERLGVSRTPVREALVRLRQVGLIEPEGRRGGRVIRPSSRAILHAYEVREGLECFAARAAAERATAAQRAEILAAARESLAGAQSGDEEQFRRGDSAFHAGVQAVAANPRLSALLDDIFALIVTLRRRDTPDREESTECGHAHVAVAEAIAAGDAEAAEREMRGHVRHVMGFVLAAFADDPAAS